MVIGHPEFPLAAGIADGDQEDGRGGGGPKPDGDAAADGFHDFDGGDELIADLGEGFEEGGLTGDGGECFAELEDVLGEVVFFDVNVGPDEIAEFLFVDRTAGAFEQSEEQIELFGGECEGLVAPNQGAGARVEGEFRETIQRVCQLVSVTQVFESIEI